MISTNIIISIDSIPIKMCFWIVLPCITSIYTHAETADHIPLGDND